MNETTLHRIQLLQGNATVRRLMAEALEASGFQITGEADDEASDLLVVDVDSDLALSESAQRSWADSERPVLVCGLRNSREHYPDVAWMQRPFSPDGLVAECRHLLGLAEVSELEEDSTPQTQRLTVDDAEKLERELGLEKGTLDLSHEDSEAQMDLSLEDTNNLGPDAVPEFLELETSNSIELDVDDLEEVGEMPSGGALLGEVERESVRVDELDWSAPIEKALQAPRRETLNQTMPDAPAVMAPREVVDEDSSPSALSEPSDFATATSRGSQADLGPKLERQIERVSQVLGDSWGRIGLAARPRDRANHIRGVLRALFAEGTAAAAAEVERIPGASGFSGDLAALGLVDLLYTIRTRGLRGRLELSVGADDFVLYLDADSLVDLENISGSDDKLLLDILLEEGSIAHQIYEELERSLADELAAPVQMRLRQDELVSPQDLAHARQERVIRLYRALLSCEHGSFAFVAVEEGTGQAWPVEGLGISVDALLDEVLLDSERCESSDSSALTKVSGQDNRQAFFPQGFDIDDQLTPTVEVPDPDSDR